MERCRKNTKNCGYFWCNKTSQNHNSSNLPLIDQKESQIDLRVSTSNLQNINSHNSRENSVLSEQDTLLSEQTQTLTQTQQSFLQPPLSRPPQMQGPQPQSEFEKEEIDRLMEKFEIKFEKKLKQAFDMTEQQVKEFAESLVIHVMKERIKVHFTTGFQEIWDLFMDIKNHNFKFWENINQQTQHSLKQLKCDLNKDGTFFFFNIRH